MPTYNWFISHRLSELSNAKKTGTKMKPVDRGAFLIKDLENPCIQYLTKNGYVQQLVSFFINEQIKYPSCMHI